MKFGVLLTGAAFAALGLAACNPPHPKPKPPLKAIATLDCPAEQGDLTRQSAAADGKSCVYTTSEGDQLTLQLISLGGKSARDTLGPIEAQLQTELPGAGEDAPAPPGPPPPPGAPPPPSKDRVDIDLPGIHIHASGDDHANVDAGGVHVDAHDRPGHGGDHASVKIDGGPGGVHINANDHGAQVRIEEGGSGIRARYILASDTPGPHGYKVVGYEARGPAGGPMAVAVLLSKSDDKDTLKDEIHELLQHNVGG